ncbi:protein DOUBLE-STRAND BREAK FORMATION isoform X1 [Vigna angularis]|uniref:protein DOUBLE-STRAND BREAK FORMATION isoform X1 n=1 Tax=Phaseolus angularis TaxID=3914 RepID=UPI0022B3F5B7|nr:protein DOUBLE-STRAND BREAK FORMATION isoform X1 [Vigna angularis]
MSHSDEQLSFLRSLIHGRRFSFSCSLSVYLSSHLTFHLTFGSFSDATIRFLESLLVSKDVKSFIEVRSSLTDFLRSESLSVIRSIASKTVHEKLLVLEFFVRAFALVGDQQSCLALRYEALVMRELKSASCRWLQVLPEEWLRFVEDAVRNGFHAVAEKACENALSCLENNDDHKPGGDMVSKNLKSIISEITRLRNCAMTSVSSRSVQVQTAEYLKRKTTEQKSDLPNKQKRCLASTSFRNGIKRQNIRKLHEHQSLLLVSEHPNLRSNDQFD